ncbi:uncharacterized protein [Miscanthus floridulus]|uniref:uncharacterized protein isoform X3 n=1 Tax=Miscanthus floridulus TaxID=154761 RepID=UPI003458E0FC
MPLYLVSSPAAAKLAAGGPHAPPHRRPQLLFRAPHRPSRRAPLLSSAAEHPAERAMAAAETGASTETDSRLRGVKQALISLSDKTDLANLGNGLQHLGFSIISTGGTASSLEASGVNVTEVEEITHFPEMLDGRVKTLHPSIHGGILARRDQEHHLKALKEHGIGTFDVVVVNLYPFYDKVTTGAISFEDGIENIDIGGPTLIRAAAKNHKDVLVVVDHKDYPALLEYLERKQDDPDFRRTLAWKAFQHVASYDSAVSEWLWKQSNKADTFPPSFTVPLTVKSTLRYGENPHQKAAFYGDKSLSLVNAGGIATAIQHHGKDLAREIREFRSPTDGGTRMFYEIVVAPGYTEKGLEVLKVKSKTLRILEAKRSGKGMLSLRQVTGGWLAQESDDVTPEDITFTKMSERTPGYSELSDAKFACLCIKHVKSNAIVIAKNNCMLGMGSGQPNRRESLRIAFKKAGEEAKGAALASDAFFPFAWNDAVEEACQSGIAVIAEPGGSIRDQDTMDCCNKYGVALVFTGVRHFRH